MRCDRHGQAWRQPLVWARQALVVALLVAAHPARAQVSEADSSAAPVLPIGQADDTTTAATSSVVSERRLNERLMITTRMVRLREKSNVIRTGPGSDYAIASVQPRDQHFEVLAKRDGWNNVKLSDSESGWVHESLCEEYDDLSGLKWRPNPKLYTRTGSYVLNGYAGAYAFDKKSNSFVAGGRIGYYVFDRVQAEVGVAWTHVDRPAEIVESLFDLSLEAETFHMLFYNLGLTFEILPGRQMVPFVTAGVGSTIMLGRSEPSFHYGAGTTLFLSKRTAMRWEFRDYRFSSGSDNARRENDNVEFSLGTLYLF